MRLGTCIALELAVAVSAVGGVVLAVGEASRLAGSYLVSHEASAANLESVVPLPRSHLRVEPAAASTIFGAPDEELLAPLGAAKVSRIKTNHGGTSLSLRIDFENGARAAFKPEQIHPQSDPRREIAAYRIDRLLEIGRVPPARPISLAVAELLDAAEPSHRTYISRRLDEEALARGGVLHGELSWWIPEIKRARIGRLPIDEREGRAQLVSYLQVGAQIPAEARSLVEQIAACVVFDVLIDNPDRWSGNNTVMSPDGRTFYFMDNTMSFSLARFGQKANAGMLERIQVFPRALVQRLRALDEQALTEALARDGDTPLGPLLAPAEIRAVLQRRDHILRHVDQLIAAHGEASVLALP